MSTKSAIRVHYLQHVPFEDLGYMRVYFEQRNAVISKTEMFNDEALPSIQDFDVLIVMGGSMGVYDLDAHPWISREIQFIKQGIEANKSILGICLGAQLIANALGANVAKNRYREIGWFDVYPTQGVNETILGTLFKQPFEVFHWHGDRFELPNNADRLCASDACDNQAFIVDDRIIGLQFHMETTYESASALIRECADEIDGSKYVQEAAQMLERADRFTRLNARMEQLLGIWLEYNGLIS